MKTRILIMMLLVVLSFPSYSQKGSNMQQREAGKDSHKDMRCNPEELEKKIMTMKIGFLTQELELSEQEASVFWPIYNKYNKEIKTIREKNRPVCNKDTAIKMKRRPDFLKLEGKEAKEVLDNYLQMEKDVADVQIKYAREFEKVLPVQKVAKLFFAEKEFMSDMIRGKGKYAPDKCKADNNKKSFDCEKKMPHNR